MEAARTTVERRAAALEKLSAANADAWVATAADGQATLVPLSYAWDGTHILLATEASAASARNLRASGQVRLGLGTTRDVVMVDATLVEEVRIADATEAIMDRYADQTDWDPRTAGPGYVYLVLLPQRIQVWREVNEIAGRTVMRDGAWAD